MMARSRFLSASPARGLAVATLALLASVVPAHADVRAGVEAWARGDYPAAVAQWQEPADKGDPDALFNMGQAYKLGRGVQRDLAKAEDYYRKAADKGHVRAADNYGILLFQTNRQREAMPWLTAAAERGEPRAMYILGIAAYNGDYAAKDWVRAYALMTRAANSGLSQAVSTLAAMNQALSQPQRQAGAALAQDMERKAEAARSRDMASADLGAAEPVTHPVVRSPAKGPAGSVPATSAPPAATAGPVTAGADYANPVVLPPVLHRVEPAAIATQPKPQPVLQPKPAPVHPAPSGGSWRIQFGAFGQKANADALWAKVRTRAEVTGHPRLDVGSGVTRLQAGGYAEAEAQRACTALKGVGFACLVVKD